MEWGYASEMGCGQWFKMICRDQYNFIANRIQIASRNVLSTKFDAGDKLALRRNTVSRPMRSLKGLHVGCKALIVRIL